MTTSAKRNGTRNAKSTAARTPPQNLNAEKALLGSVMLGGHETFDEVSPSISADDFYLGDHSQIWRAIVKLREQDEPLDSVLIGKVASNILDDGERATELLVEAMESVPHQGRAKNYADLIVEASRRRQAILAATDLQYDAFNESVDLDDTITAAEGKLHKILERTSGEAVPVAEVVHSIVERIGKAKKPGLLTGFCDIDRVLGGFYPGQLIILAARPGVGKTALAGNLALHIAEAGTGVLFISLEQSRDELTERFVCSMASIDTDALNSQKISEAGRDSITHELNALARLPILIDDTASRTIAQIAALARIHRRRDKIGVVIVDYLTLITPEDKRTPREQQVAEITRSLKLLARGLEIPVLALAQLNRNVESRDSKRPRLSDLRESGAIEQDADTVMFLDRPGSHDENAVQTASTLIVAKHRNGRTGDVSLYWDARSMTFKNAAQPREGEF